MIRRPPRSTQSRSSAASDVYKRQSLFKSVHARTRRQSGGRIDRRAHSRGRPPARMATSPRTAGDTGKPCSRILEYPGIAIYAEFRGQGLASNLLDHAVQLASRSGARGVSIVVEDTNTAAITLYMKKGFEKAETLPWIAYGGRVGPANWLMLTKPSEVFEAKSGTL